MGAPDVMYQSSHKNATNPYLQTPGLSKSFFPDLFQFKLYNVDIDFQYAAGHIEKIRSRLTKSWSGQERLENSPAK